MKIHDYASQGDREGVRNELSKEVFVDTRNEQDLTPLACAADSPHANEDMLRLLIDAGADVNAAVDRSKSFPVGLAAGSGSLSKVQYLLNAGANVNCVAPKGYTVLINVMYSLCKSPMLVPMVELLVGHGAQIDCATNYGESPLGVASFQGRFDVVKYLLDAGADPSPLMWTELMEAIALGSCEDVERLLSGTSGLEDRDSCGRTPWLLVSFVGDVKKASGLYSVGVNLEERGRGGDTALMHCAARGNADMLCWLAEVGADIEAVNDAGNTALMLAAQAGSTACAELLLEIGATVGCRNTYNDNAMSLASNERIIELLVGAGGDIGDISTEMKRMLTGLSGDDTLLVSKSEYLEGRRRRFGTGNPEMMDVAFWKEMVRAGVSAYEARMQFGDTDNMAESVWCFHRFGVSFTTLPDGRFVQIGGEHEDFYDPDFCIYNDVIVHDRSGRFTMFGYPQLAFPPTDFHCATYVDGVIYIIGGLGYHGSRRFGITPIHRLNCETWQMTSIQSFGENPGWIYSHRASLTDSGILVISGGKVCKEVAGEEQHVENEDTFYLDLSSMIWSRTPAIPQPVSDFGQK